MATRRGIAEQILRIISGGEPTTEIDISIREIMFLVDQERDAMIKAEILDSMYTKGVANSKAELEILGQYLIEKSINLIGGIKGGSGVGLYGLLPGLMSLPKDMAVQHVRASGAAFSQHDHDDDNLGEVNIPTNRQRRVVEVSVDEGLVSNSTGELLLFGLTNGPLKMDDNYIISFTLNTGDDYTEPKEHKISFNVNTKKYKNTIYSWQGLAQAIKASNDFKKFLKDFKLKHVSGGGDTTQSDIIISGLYNFSISNLQINSADSGGSHGFVYTSVDTNGFTQDQISDTSLEIIINNTPYTVDFSNEDWGDAISADGIGVINALTAAQYVAKAFVLKNADKIAKEQNIAVTAKAPLSTNYFGQDGEGGPNNLIWFVEMTQRGGFNISVSSPGIITPTILGNTQAYIAGYDEATGNPNQWGAYNQQGYYPARFKKNKTFTRMPSNGQYNTLYDKAVTMSGRDYYYIQGNKIYLYEKYNTDDFDQIVVTFLSNSSYLNDNDPYPVPSDHVNIIIKNVIQILGVMRQAKKDMTNDNLK